MNCLEISTLLLTYLEGDLPSAQARAVSEHLRGCPRCAREAEELHTLFGAIAEAPIIEASPDFRAAVLARACPPKPARVTDRGEVLTRVLTAAGSLLSAAAVAILLLTGVAVRPALRPLINDINLWSLLGNAAADLIDLLHIGYYLVNSVAVFTGTFYRKFLIAEPLNAAAVAGALAIFAWKARSWAAPDPRQQTGN